MERRVSSRLVVAFFLLTLARTEAQDVGDTKAIMTELRAGCNKLLHAIERNESMSAKDWMAYYDQCFKLCTAGRLC